MFGKRYSFDIPRSPKVIHFYRIVTILSVGQSFYGYVFLFLYLKTVLNLRKATLNDFHFFTTAYETMQIIWG